jgi:hypothetical protein
LNYGTTRISKLKTNSSTTIGGKVAKAKSFLTTTSKDLIQKSTTRILDGKGIITAIEVFYDSAQ